MSLVFQKFRYTFVLRCKTMPSFNTCHISVFFFFSLENIRNTNHTGMFSCALLSATAFPAESGRTALTPTPPHRRKGILIVFLDPPHSSSSASRVVLTAPPYLFPSKRAGGQRSFQSAFSAGYIDTQYHRFRLNIALTTLFVAPLLRQPDQQKQLSTYCCRMIRLETHCVQTIECLTPVH